MPTQEEIANHLDLSPRRVRDILKNLDIDHKQTGLDAIRIRYIQDLRAKAAGHRSDDGMDLTKERVLTERVEREIKSLQLMEKIETLVIKDLIDSSLRQVVVSAKTEILSFAKKIKKKLRSRYKVDIPDDEIDEPVRVILRKLSTIRKEHDQSD